MRFLKLLAYLAVTLVLAWFAARNWTSVTVNLWPPYQLVIRLPVLLVAAALLGALPGAVIHSASRWRWRRQLARAALPPEPFPAKPDVLPEAQPLIVPPAGA